jgi:hypothetical protein
MKKIDVWKRKIAKEQRKKDEQKQMWREFFKKYKTGGENSE